MKSTPLNLNAGMKALLGSAAVGEQSRLNEGKGGVKKGVFDFSNPMSAIACKTRPLSHLSCTGFSMFFWKQFQAKCGL
jgi:hypothetical protein